ncbi:HAD hydrolase family protein [Candidatus Bathyarchaeota archaeon]|nr:HAD hydrolase family protein [Candidatus Bathyarchaeota archaeon]
MKQEDAVFITDCEGPISKNDNAFELTCHFIPDGDRFFTLISRYDDIQADIVKRPGYKPGDTLKLILPFLKAYGATNEKMKAYSSQNILLVPGADETLRFVSKIMPSFIVSTSYEHYIAALCDAIGFPKENAYCTKVNIDEYVLCEDEIKRLKELRKEISEMPMLEIPEDASAFEDLSKEIQHAVRRLDEIFWEEISQMKAGRMLQEVNPVGGFEKANAVKEIIEKTRSELSNVIYFGDSITDVDPFRLIREGGGLTVSFNGNQYAIREAEIAVMSHNTIIISILADLFRKIGKEGIIQLAEEWSPSSLKEICEPSLLMNLQSLPIDKTPRVERITPENMSRLTRESSAFRKTVRGEAIGRLG